MQAAFGKGALNVASLLTYIGLGLGLLGSSLAVPFGLFVLVFQRDQEKFIQVGHFHPSCFQLFHYQNAAFDVLV